MHEVALANSLAELVAEEVARNGGTRATKLVLEIGTLSHVDRHALLFAFDSAARGGPAEGAEIEVREPPGTAYCLDCETTVTIAARGEACPACDGVKLLVQGGDEMRLKEMEIA